MALLCIGWNSGYNLWLFALVCIFFLPSFGKLEEKTSNRPLIFGIFYVIVYFAFGFLIPSGLVKPFYEIQNMTSVVLFGINSAIVFVSIIAFTYFYTTRQKVKEDNLKRLADYDVLTNLKNRNAINHIIDQKIKEGNNKFSVAILDIDWFKHVNDTYGHNAGDLILKEIARKMKELEGFGITCARWGGEEFLILGPNDMPVKDFVDILNSYRRTIRESQFKYDRSIIKVTVSIGVAEYNKNTSIKNVIEKADSNLYKAKESGRNKTVF